MSGAPPGGVCLYLPSTQAPCGMTERSVLRSDRAGGCPPVGVERRQSVRADTSAPHGADKAGAALSQTTAISSAAETESPVGVGRVRSHARNLSTAEPLKPGLGTNRTRSAGLS